MSSQIFRDCLVVATIPIIKESEAAFLEGIHNKSLL